jgi:cytoskeletal protein RodZ
MIGWRSKTPTAQADKPKGFDDFDLRLGDLMRGERATLGKSLLDVQRDLKIKASYIAAIENADISAFETPGFIAGFVRSYARYLGMNPDEAFRRFCVEARFEPAHGMSAAASSATLTAARARKSEESDGFANPMTPFSPVGPNWAAQVQPGAIGSVMVLVAVACAIGFGAWTVLQEVQRVTLSPVDQAPVVVTQIDPLQSTGNGAATVAALDPVATGAAPTATAAPTGLDRLYAARPLEVPVMEARDGPIAAIDPGTTGVLGDNQPGAADPAAELVKVLADVSAPVEVFAVRPSWVQVASADGKVIFEAILNAGERYVVPALDAAPVLRSGNSGSVYFLVDGQTFGPASPGANVVKNVALSADALKATYAAADPTADADLQVFVENLVAPAVPVAP